MKIHHFLCFFVLVAWLSACTLLKESPKYEFADGTYRVKVNKETKQTAYVRNLEDSIQINFTNSNQPVLLLKIPKNTDEKPTEMSFTITSFDIDALTSVFKFRPSAQGFPPQLNTDFNGSVYVGQRWDKYAIRYRKTELGSFKRDKNHLGYSLGGFFGIGATAVNPFVTNNAIMIDYDGLVLSKGVALIVGLNNLTLGLGIGIDGLLDANRQYWIYQNKPWVGLTLGLNIN